MNTQPTTVVDLLTRALVFLDARDVTEGVLGDIKRALEFAKSDAAAADLLLHELDKIQELIDGLKVENATLRGALSDALDFVDDHSDIKDGPYGEPRPNRAMSLAQELRTALVTANTQMALAANDTVQS